MVFHKAKPSTRRTWLSVLALSSRFDGPAAGAEGMGGHVNFQYSLCRVVLMVLSLTKKNARTISLSVLALSSRFDGPKSDEEKRQDDQSFSTRSVESF